MLQRLFLSYRHSSAENRIPEQFWYLDELLTNVEARFEEQSMDKLGTADKIIKPKHLPDNSTAICSYGEDHLDTIVSWLCPINKDTELIGPERMRGDYLQFKLTVKSLRGKTFKRVCQYVIEHFSDMFPDYAILAKYLLTVVACFNKLNKRRK